MGQAYDFAPVLLTFCYIVLPFRQGRGSPSAVLWAKLMILLLVLFTVSEIALPIRQGRGRLVLQEWGRVVSAV